MKEEACILIIDDESSMLNEFENVFTKEGYQVRKAQTWPEAYEYLKNQKFNVVITDVDMPDVDYQQAIKEIKSADKTTYVITSAGYSEIDKAMESLNHGAQNYISKPFDPIDIIASIRRVIEKQKLQSDNVQLFDTIKALALALDARDHYTHGHSQEVTDYAVAIAGDMDLALEDIERIRDAGMLHDIGKIGIRDEVLLKPGRLTEEEYTQIKKHPEIGRKILEPVRSLADKIPLIYHHHERFDGHGYPEGLAGDNIPLGARILSVADAYQAMTSDRPYRKALPQEVAISELNKGRDKQFDSRIVDIFIDVLKKNKV
ncbi:MAG: response regulator [PVC group bacterium]|nr:response regulator [PVC group bacterium]